jgi:hypothetical protein
MVDIQLGLTGQFAGWDWKMMMTFDKRGLK